MKLIASAAWGDVVHDRNSEVFISTSAVLYSVQPAYVCPWASPFLSIGIASRSAKTNPVQTCFFGVNEKGMPCTNEKEFSLLRYDYVLCQSCKAHVDSLFHACRK